MERLRHLSTKQLALIVGVSCVVILLCNICSYYWWQEAQRYNELYAKSQSYAKKLPQEMATRTWLSAATQQEPISIVQDLAAQTQIQILSYDQMQQEGAYTITAIGEFYDILIFLNAMERQLPLIIIREMTLERQEANNNMLMCKLKI